MRRTNSVTTLILIAKEPIAGRVKTRLTPDVTFGQAAMLASAAIADTVVAGSAVSASRRILYYDGTIPPAGTEGWDVVPQVDGDLDERLAAILDLCDGPTVLLGMDTPQVTGDLLAPMFRPWPDGIDAWFGPASDGGLWCLALAEPRGDLVRGVPMSRDDTGAIQYDRMRAAALTVALLPTLTDVDTIDSAREVAALAPSSRFAAMFAHITGAQIREPQAAETQPAGMQTNAPLTSRSTR